MTIIRNYYSKHDDFNRYSMANEERVREIRRIYSLHQRFFGRRVLDIACGAGIMGFVLEEKGIDYLGIDTNPDMVRLAKTYAGLNNSIAKFLLGDARSTKIEGVFDTITLVGNAVIHFDTYNMVRILTNIRQNVSKGAHFIVDYRDLVKMLYSGEWGESRTSNEKLEK
jgi:2-polyprenyl-3-methyl-5-hydroxy-6-metoxy-1,4-benzoquinol methylase